MDILGKNISEHTAEIIADIEGKLSRPVEYHFTDVEKTKSFGTFDVSQDGVYHVYSKEALFNLTKAKAVNVPFETNIVRQLLRICQVEEGFPQVETRIYEVTELNVPFYDNLGAIYASAIMELNVDMRMKEMGLSSEYFFKHSMNQADKIARRRLKISDEMNFSRYACQLMRLNLSCPGPEMDELFKLYQTNNTTLVVLAGKLSKAISEKGYSNAEEAFASLVVLFQTFNIWFTHRITYKGQTMESFEDVQKAFPDLKVDSLF